MGQYVVIYCTCTVQKTMQILLNLAESCKWQLSQKVQKSTRFQAFLLEIGLFLLVLQRGLEPRTPALKGRIKPR